MIANIQFDPYKLYCEVKKEGGYITVCENNLWQEITKLLDVSASSQAASSLSKKYTLLGLDKYERVFDLNCTDQNAITATNTSISSNHTSSKKHLII